MSHSLYLFYIQPPPAHFSFFFFFFNDTATTEIYTLSLHDALPIFLLRRAYLDQVAGLERNAGLPVERHHGADRKSTRLNSSHGYISYAVFCLKKKKKKKIKILNINTERTVVNARITNVQQ